MIAKIISGTSFRGCAQYLFRNQTAELLGGSGLRFSSIDELITDFESMLLLVENAPAKPVGHTILSFSHDDRHLSQLELFQIAKTYMKQMKLENTPWALVRHSDKDHQHVHLVYSALNYEGRMVDQRHNFTRSKKVCQKIEAQFSLAITSGKRLDRTNISALRGADLCKYQILIVVQQAIKDARSWSDFVMRMNREGIGVELSGSELSRGVRFTKVGYHFAGSKIDRSLSFRNIERRVECINAKREGLSPVVRAAIAKARGQTRRNTGYNVNRSASLLRDVKQMFHTQQMPSSSTHTYRSREDEDEEKKESLEQQRYSRDI